MSSTKDDRNTPFDEKWPGNVKYAHGVTRQSLDDATEEEWNHAAAMQRQVGGNHYKDLAIQPITYIMANDMGYCAANIVKYATRAEQKNGIEDIEKIIHYAQLWLENFR